MATALALQPTPKQTFLARWVYANIIGDFIGFGGAVAVAVFSIQHIQPNAPLVLLSAVLCSSMTIGVAQWWALHKRLPTLQAGSWIIATGMGGVIVWAMIMRWGNWGIVMAGMPMAVSQWIVLRRRVHPSIRWIPTYTLAWAIGMIILFAGTSISTTVGIVTGLSVAILMGFTHGAVLVQILERANPHVGEN